MGTESESRAPWRIRAPKVKAIITSSPSSSIPGDFCFSPKTNDYLFPMSIAKSQGSVNDYQVTKTPA
jgi:hypothetical protein